MNILIIEDDPNKLLQLTDCVRGLVVGADIVTTKSYQSGLREAVLRVPDVIVLDMSMPTYDVTPVERGGKIRPFAGREILHQLKRRSVHTRVVVVTQFERFGDGSDVMTLDALGTSLREEFADQYLGTVFYQPGHDEWREALRCVFTGLLGR